MSKILMFSLVDRIEQKAKGVTYLYENEEYKNKYLLELYFEKLDFDKIVCFGTPQSSWDYLYKLLYKKYYNNEPDLKSIEILKEISELRGEDFVEVLESFFFKDEILKDKIIIKYFEESLEKKEMLDYIYKLKEELTRAEKIFVDLTGGQRDTPILIVQLLNLAIRDKRTDDIEILYAKLRKENYFEVIQLNDFIEKINYTHDISPFTKYGCPLKFKKYFKDEKLKKYLDDLYIYSQYNLAQNLVSHIDKFKTMKVDYSAYIQQKIIETKIKKWENIIPQELDRDILKNYQLELSNEALAIISKVAKLEEENKDIRIEDKEFKEIKDLRNSIIHPYNKKNISYKDLEKILEKEFKKDKEKLPEILIVNVGDASKYKKVSFEEIKLETYFSFKAILKNSKFERIFFVGSYSNVWNNFIDKWIEEEDLDIKRKNNIEIENNSEENFEKILNEELKNIGKKIEEKTKVKYKFEAIILNNSFTLEDRNRYFEKLLGKLINGTRKYSITYDLTSSFRDVSYINYINLHCLELLDMLKIKKLLYISVDNTNNSAKINDMDKIISVMSLLKSIDEFILYNKFSDSIDINEYLKSLMRKVSRMYNFNQVSSLGSIKGEIDNFKNTENRLEEEILEHIKKTYTYNVSDKYEKAKIMVKNQLAFNNLAQALYLTWDMVLNGLIKDDDDKIDQSKKTDFLKQADKYDCKELYDFYQKYKSLSAIRAEISHINLNEVLENLEEISKKIENCLTELDVLIKNKDKYTKIFHKKFY